MLDFFLHKADYYVELISNEYEKYNEFKSNLN